MTRSERQDRPTRNRPIKGRGTDRPQTNTRGAGRAPARRRPAPSQGGEFALPQTVTPALPAVESFDALDMPAALLKTLAAQGVTEPFPIQGATLPNSLVEP